MQTDIIGIGLPKLKIEPNRLFSALGLGAGRLMSLLVALVEGSASTGAGCLLLAASADTEAGCSVMLPVGLVQDAGKFILGRFGLLPSVKMPGTGDKRHRSLNSNWSGINFENKQRRLSRTSKP